MTALQTAQANTLRRSSTETLLEYVIRMTDHYLARESEVEWMRRTGRTAMNYVDRQNIDGTCESVHIGADYTAAYRAYQAAIDSADWRTANISWYFNLDNTQEHIGTMIFRSIQC